MSEYPERLLPVTNYRIISDEVLMSQNNLWLVRHIDSGTVEFIGNTKTVSPNCINIQKDHLKDLSNNLLGVFKVEDVYYGINKDVNTLYCCYWNGIDKCDIPTKDHFFKDENRGYYFIPVDILLSKNFPDNETCQNYHFKILHTPTKCNYWHISIRVYDNNDLEVSTLEVTNGKKRRIWKMVKDYLVTHIIRTEISGVYATLDSNIFCKDI